jgi:hypothetical protein
MDLTNREVPYDEFNRITLVLRAGTLGNVEAGRFSSARVDVDTPITFERCKVKRTVCLRVRKGARWIIGQPNLTGDNPVLVKEHW